MRVVLEGVVVSLTAHIAFLLCVALATFVQSLTGFAFGLVLLGLVAMGHIAPVASVAAAMTVLTLVNAGVALSDRGAKPYKPALLPVLTSSFIGVGVGVFLLGWLGETTMPTLRGLLGVVIILGSLPLVFSVKAGAQMGPRWWYLISGSFTGLLSGLFATGGPPLVVHLYRQPLPLQQIRDTLLLVFAANALVRLGGVFIQGSFTYSVLLLTLEALPVVFGVSWLVRRYPPRIPDKFVRWTVFFLLLAAGGNLVWTTWF